MWRNRATFLLQIDVDAAEEDALLADVLLVGADGRVGGDEQGVVAAARQGGDQRVVVHAAAAEHAGGAGGDVGDAFIGRPLALDSVSTSRPSAPAEKNEATRPTR